MKIIDLIHVKNVFNTDAEISDIKTAYKIVKFIKAIEKGHLSPNKMQEAYYTASQILAYSNKYDDNIMKYLELAYDIDKDSSVASDIKYTIDALQKLFEVNDNAEQQEQN